MTEYLADYLKRHTPKQFAPSMITTGHGTVDVCLENVPCYHDWIGGEGADVSLWRAMDDDRIVGATLPLKDKL